MTTSLSSVIKKLLVLFLVIAGLYFAKDFLIPLAISAVLSTLFLPFCKWMEKKAPKWLAVLICITALLIVIASIGALLGWQISEVTNDIALIKERVLETSNRVQKYIYNHYGITVERQSQILKDGRPSVNGIMQRVLGPLASLFTNFILVLVYVFGMLYYRDHIKHFLLKLSPPDQRKEMEKVVYSVTLISQQYLLGLSKMIIGLWIMYGIGFSIVGIENALFFAFLCGLLEIVPFIGNIIGTSITVLAAAVQGASIPMLIGVVGTYGVVQFIQGWVLEPMVVGSQVKINPLFTIIALVMGELIWGIPGIFLAIPLIAMFKTVCDHIESLKPYGFLIGEVETVKRESGFIRKIKSWYKRH